jgi:penicillin-binding protein 1A
MRAIRIGLGVLAALLVLAAALFAAAWASTPSAADLARQVQRLDGVTPALSVRGVAPILARAVVATEDERFYHHHGIDVLGLLRAAPYDLVHLSFAQGGSTITEQLAKLLYLQGDDHSPWRKLEDMALAVKLEDHYSKPAILAAYLDTAYYGAGAQGITAASMRYFGVPAGRLTLPEASLLAGLPQAPSLLDPFTDPTAARARQLDVLRSLVRVHAISFARAEAVLEQPLQLRGGSRLAPLPPSEAALVAPGPALAWSGAAIGIALACLGIAVVALRGRLREPALVARASAVIAALFVLFGVTELLRSFRTL